MRKILSLMAAILFAGSMMAEVGSLYYTFLPYKPSSGAVSDYTKTGTMTIDEMHWTVPGNWFGNGALRLGGKSIENVDREIISQDPMGSAISKIRIAHAGKTADAITLNSVTVTTASDAEFTQNVTTKTVTDFTVAKNTKDTIDVVPATEPWATNSYYKIAFNFTNANGTNYAFVVEKILFYAYASGEGGGEDPQPQPQPLADGFYLVGDFAGVASWSPVAERMFVVNPDNEAEMMLAGVTLAADDSLKVVYVENEAIVTWFPAEAGNYVVDAAHAGVKDIYFRADYAGDQNYWYAGCIFIAENVEPEPEPVDPNQMYIWNGIGVTTAEEAIELGGAAEAYQIDGTNIVIGASQKGNWCIKINKKFDNGNYYAGIALDNAVNAGDTIKIAYFRTSASSTYVLGMDFSADQASASTTYQILTEGDPQVLESSGTPEESIFIIPEGVANAKYIRLYRNSGSTGVWIAKFAIAKKSGETPEPQPEPELANGYYLVGDFAGVASWNPVAERMLVVNPANENEMMLAGFALAVDDSLKVVYVENEAIVTWFPAEAGNYVVDAAHAGEKDIYFRADYAGGEGWYEGCIYIVENVEPQPQPDPENLWKVTEATEVAAGTVYLDNDLLKLESVYAGVLVGNERTFGNITFTHAVCVRVEAWPTTEVPTGTQNTKGTPLVLTAKENATITLYYHRQAVSGAYAENDNKDLVVYDQADLSTKLTGVFTMVAETEAGAYATATKELELVKGHVYTICCKGTTIQLHGMMYEAGEPEPLADGFYLVGSMNEWTPAAEYKFAVNPDNEAEMMLAGVTLAENAELKVRQVENGEATAWFPAEAGNYVVDADHAGLKDIYFRADYAGAEDWYAGCIYIAANSGTAIINTEAAKVAVKQLRNGMVIIRRGDREYSIMGQMVK